MTKADRLFKAYGEWVVRWRWLVLFASLAATVAAGWGLQFLAMKNDYRMWFSEENPQLQAFEELQDTYTKNDNVLFVIAPESGEVFTQRVLEVVHQVTDEGWQLPYSIRVDSITNFQHTRAIEDDLNVADLIEDPTSVTAADIEYAKQVALAEPVLFRKLISEDAAVTAVNITFQLPDDSLTAVPETAGAIRDLARRIETEYPDIKVYLTGVVMMNATFAESGKNDIMTLVPWMVLAIVIVMWILIRSVVGTITTLLLAFMSAVVSLGIGGWNGLLMTSPVFNAPTMIMTLAVADSIHLLITMFSNMNRGMNRHEALIDSIRINMQPVFLTSITTAIGFLSMNFSDAPPFRDLGNVTAGGVIAAFVFSVTFLPAVMAIFPVRTHKVVGGYTDSMGRLADWVIRNRNPVLAGTAIASIGILAFVPRIELNDQFIRYFDESIPFRADTDFTTANLTGIYQVQFSIPSNETNGVSNPRFISDLEEFTTWLRARPDVAHVSSLSDTFKRLNKNMHGDDPSWYRVPEQKDLAAQYLLLYEFSLPFGLDLNNQLDIDKASTQLFVTLIDMSSRELREFVQQAEVKLADINPEMRAPGIGTSVMFAYIAGRNIKSMLVGIFFGLVVISILLVFALKSLKMGMISLIPNLLPAGISFGLWGIFIGEVNMAVSVVAAVTLGIVVDDSVHFLSKYLRARRERGLNADDSVRYAFTTVGMALVITTVILTFGFVVLGYSSFEVNSAMATLTAIAIVIALVVDFLLLPPLLMKIDGDPGEERVPELETTGEPQTAT